MINPREYRLQSPYKIYFNIDENQYELGLGEEIETLSGCYFNSGVKDVTFSNPTQQVITEDKFNVISSAFNNAWCFNYILDGKTKLPELADFNKKINFNPEVNDYIANYTTKQSLTVTMGGGKSGWQYSVYFRHDTYPDLDYQDGTAKEELCGVYGTDLLKNTDSNYRYTAVGSPVLGDNLGNRYIGISNNYFSSYSNPAGNCFPTWPADAKLPTQNRYFINNYRASYFWYFGTTYNSNTKKNLVMLISDKFTGEFKANRIFLLEGSQLDPTKHTKFYYYDFPGLEDTLISYPDEYCIFNTKLKLYHDSSQFIGEYRFKYINLEDSTDTKEDITLSCIGFTRINPYLYMFGETEKLGTASESKLNDYENIYVGDWIVPTIEFGEINYGN